MEAKKIDWVELNTADNRWLAPLVRDFLSELEAMRLDNVAERGEDIRRRITNHLADLTAHDEAEEAAHERQEACCQNVLDVIDYVLQITVNLFKADTFIK